MAHVIAHANQALLTARVVWLALVMGVVLFMAIGVFLAQGADPTEPRGQKHSDHTLLVIASAMPVVMIPMGLLVRRRMLGGSAPGHVVTPSAYVGACVVSWACAEGAAMFAITTMILAQRVTPNIYPAAVCLIAMILQWPTGREMTPPDPTKHER